MGERKVWPPKESRLSPDNEKVFDSTSLGACCKEKALFARAAAWCLYGGSVVPSFEDPQKKKGSVPSEKGTLPF